jgi:hypothetical protein
MIKKVPLLILAVSVYAALAAGVAHASPSLDDKLAEQWRLYEKARTEVAEHVGRQSGTIARDEWEQLLTPAAGLELSPQDLAGLKQRQRALVSQARSANLASSVLDLQAVRASARQKEFCSALPKGGMLHVHPWGTLDEETVTKILTETDAVIKVKKLKESLGDVTAPQFMYPSEIGFLSSYSDLTPFKDLAAADRDRLRALFFLKEGPYDFKRFMGAFALVSTVVFSNPAKDPSPLMWDAFFKRSRDNNLRYVEVSGTVPKAFALPKLPAWQKTYQDRYGVIGAQLGAFARANDPEKNRQGMKDLLALPASEVFRGINLVADEGDHPMLEKGQSVYAQLLAARADHQSSLRATVHAGELGDPRNLRDAIILGSERIGHAVKLTEDPIALQYAIDHGLAVEANLTSNVRLKSYPEIETHPFLDYLRMGLRVSLSTDDEGMFGIDLNHECAEAISRTDLNWTELRQLVTNSIDTSFAPEALRAKLAADLESDLRAFEKAWK